MNPTRFLAERGAANSLYLPVHTREGYGGFAVCQVKRAGMIADFAPSDETVQRIPKDSCNASVPPPGFAGTQEELQRKSSL